MVVIFHEVYNESHSWGDHSYEGYGVGEDGKYHWVFSSGCSCDGGPFEREIKSFIIDDVDVSEKNPLEIDFNALRCDFNSY